MSEELPILHTPKEVILIRSQEIVSLAKENRERKKLLNKKEAYYRVLDGFERSLSGGDLFTNMKKEKKELEKMALYKSKVLLVKTAGPLGTLSTMVTAAAYYYGDAALGIFMTFCSYGIDLFVWLCYR